MRLEHIPLIIGALVALIGLGFIADGLMADSAQPTTERRRRMRAERSRPGETIVGIGVLCMAAALIGRDTWRYGTVAVLVGGTLVLIGVVLNRSFLKEALLFRGPARRADPSETGGTPHVNRSSRLESRTAGRPQPPSGRPAAPSAPRAPATPNPVRPGPPVPRTPAAASIPTPVTPTRAIDSTRLSAEAPPRLGAEAPARLNADGPPPTGKVERRKTPRGKK
jgi:hypothetical protein